MIFVESKQQVAFLWKFLFLSVVYLLFCRYHAIHKQVYEWFNISFDHFGRTSTPQQTDVCQSIFKKLMDNNWLTENTMQQVCALCASYLSCCYPRR